MEFDDFFEDKRKDRGHYEGQRYHDERRYHHNQRYRDDQRYHEDDDYSQDQHHSSYGHGNNDKWLFYLGKIRNSKKLKVLAILAGIFILFVSVLLIIFLMPLILKLFNYISQNGLQGVLDAINGFLDKLWKGLGK